MPKGGDLVRDRVAGASLGRPLGYALPPVTDGVTAAGRAAPRDVLLCFPFDLEELPGGRDYREATLAVPLDDGPHAVTRHPAPGSTAADGAEVAAFGLGKDRLQWVFRAPGRSGALRPEGRWAQAVVRLTPRGPSVDLGPRRGRPAEGGPAIWCAAGTVGVVW
ncbi:hypothetical protein [Streptomyces sp. NPDC055287]